MAAGHGTSFTWLSVMREPSAMRSVATTTSTIWLWLARRAASISARWLCKLR
jgi:hypothetical protein